MAQTLRPEIISAAIQGFELQKQRLDEQIAELRQMLAGGPKQTAATPNAPGGRKKFSAATRRKMAARQRARWAKPTAESSASTPEAPRKRMMSAAGKKAIAEAQRRRWAASKGISEAATPKTAKLKRKFSAAGRKAIIEAPKRRWAAKWAEAANT